MTASAPLDERIGAWFERLLAVVLDELDGGRRSAVESDAGPLTLTHTFVPGSSHTTLTDALAGGVEPAESPPLDGRPADRAPHHHRLTVHSMEAPPRELLLPAPVTDDELGGRVAVRALAGTPWRLTWDARAGVIRCLDLGARVGVFVTAGGVEPWECGAPFRAFLHWVAADRGAAMVHGATVVGASGAALVVGPGGTGKSTSTITALDAGLGTLGDDYVWVEPADKVGDDGHVVRSVYSTVKTKRDDQAPALPTRQRVQVDDGVKTIHFLDDPPRRLLGRSAPLRAVVLLRPPGAPAPTAADAVTAAVPSTAFQLPYDEAHTAALLRRVCTSTPIVGLERDGDLHRLADELGTLLAGPPHPSGRPSVTVAVPVHNGAAHVEAAIHSVLAQEGWDVHVVAVDDGSTDGSHDLLCRLAAEQPRLTVLRFPDNRGVGAARNAAVALRRDPLLAMIDQDDRWTPDRLDRGWAALSADTSLGFVLGHQLLERPAGELPRWVRERWLDGPQPGPLFGTWLAWRSTWEAVGPLDETLSGGTDDVDWFTRAADAGVASLMIDDVVLHRTLHADNASQRTDVSTRELTAILRRSLARRDARERTGSTDGDRR